MTAERLAWCRFCGTYRFDRVMGECRNCGHGDSNGYLTIAAFCFLVGAIIFGVLWIA